MAGGRDRRRHAEHPAQHHRRADPRAAEGLRSRTLERRERIEAKLREALGAQHVDVVDESHLHVGHAGAASGGGHFRATIVSDQFEGLSRLAAQRLVYTTLAEEMQSDIHALSIKTLTPDEWESKKPS